MFHFVFLIIGAPMWGFQRVLGELIEAAMGELNNRDLLIVLTDALGMVGSMSRTVLRPR